MHLLEPRLNDASSVNLCQSGAKRPADASAPVCRLAWSKSGGILASGQSDGSVGLYTNEPSALRRANLVSKHSDEVHGVSFNGHYDSMLASASSDAEVCIWDVQKPNEPTLYSPLEGNSSSQVTQLEWNPSVQHILATTLSNGNTVVWDVRKHKAIHTIPDSQGRRKSALQWNSQTATHLVVASDDDRSPMLQVWDLRQKMSPLMELTGHSKGILSCAWSHADPNLLVSSGKDGRTLLFDMQNATVAGDLTQPSSNWVFDTSWCNASPGLVALSSADSKLSVHNATEALNVAPQWLKRPTCTSLGFGNMLAAARPHSHSVQCRQLPTLEGDQLPNGDDGRNKAQLLNAQNELQDAAAARYNSALSEFCWKQSNCDAHVGECDATTSKPWRMLYAMLANDPRRELLGVLGYSDQVRRKEERTRIAADPHIDDLGEAPHSLHDASTVSLMGAPEDAASVFESLADENDEQGGRIRSNSGELPAYEIANGDLQNAGAEEGDSNVSHHYQASSNTHEEEAGEMEIQESLVVGDWEGAARAALNVGRTTDALVIASCGSSESFEAIRRAVMAQRTIKRSVSLVRSVTDGDLSRLVNERATSQWAETLALLCSYAAPSEFGELACKLADKLAIAGRREESVLCSICGGRIDDIASAYLASPRAARDGGDVEALQRAVSQCIVIAKGWSSSQPGLSVKALLSIYTHRLVDEAGANTALSFLEMLPNSLADATQSLHDRVANSRRTQSGKSSSIESGSRNPFFSGRAVRGVQEAQKPFSNKFQPYESSQPPDGQQQPESQPLSQSQRQHSHTYSSSSVYGFGQPQAMQQSQQVQPNSDMYQQQRPPPSPKPQAQPHPQAEPAPQYSQSPHMFVPHAQQFSNNGPEQDGSAIMQQQQQFGVAAGGRQPDHNSAGEVEQEKAPRQKRNAPEDVNITEYDIASISDEQLKRVAEFVKATHAQLWDALGSQKAKEMQDIDKKAGKMAWHFENEGASEEVKQLVVSWADACERSDYAAARKAQTTLTTEHWQEAKDWVNGTKKLSKLLTG